MGRGLEGDVTDLESKRIIGNMTPKFKEGEYEGGISLGLDELQVTIATTSAQIEEKTDAAPVILLGVILGVIVFAVIVSPFTPLGGEGDSRIRGLWVPKKDSKWGTKTIGKIDKEYFLPIIPPAMTSFIPIIPPAMTSSIPRKPRSHDDDSSTSSSFSSSSWGGISFGGGSFSGGGATGSW